MKVTIKSVSGGIQLYTIVETTKYERKIYQECCSAIREIEKDLHLGTECRNATFLISRIHPIQTSEKDIEEFKISVKEFMEALHNLHVEETEQKENPEAPTEKEIEFVKNLVEPDMVTIVGAIFCEDGYCDIRISPKVFTLMCNSFIEKYGG